MQGLKAGSLLDHGKYRIERVLGSGGFGITYLATDLGLDKLRAIKEFFPKDYCDRNETTSHVTLGTSNTAEFVDKLKKKFIKEARNIAQLEHNGIIRIHTVFEENNTAYYVMDYIEGESLSAIVKREGPIEPDKAVKYIEQVSEALEYVHSHHVNHLDVKPANIMIRNKDDKPILIDFGLSKQYDSEGLQTSTTPTGISHGYAPIEQYNDGGVKEFSPQTDVYSLAATLYYIVSGKVPPHATELSQNDLIFPVGFPYFLKSPITKAMSTRKNYRHDSVKEFITSLKAKDDSTRFEPNLYDNNLKIREDLIYNKHNVEKNLNKKRRPFNSYYHKFKSLIIIMGFIIFGLGIWGIYKSIYDATNVTILNGIKVKWHDDVTPNQKKAIEYLLNNMIYIKGGTYIMGNSKFSADPNEVSERKEVVKDFKLCKYEVSQILWKTIMGTNPSNVIAENFPVQNISWNDCMNFIKKLNSLSNLKFRLPTESEWEFAAKGGNLSNGYKYSGSDSICNVAWISDNSYGIIHEIGSKLPNELGLYDMSGNVWEWTSNKEKENFIDRYITTYNPNSRFIFRGGSFCDGENCARISYRNSTIPDHRTPSLGFRIAM